MKILLNWLVSALAIVVAAYLLPGVTLNGFLPALVAAVVLGLVNAIIKPILLLLTLPINILTLGLFTVIINAFLIMLTSAIVPGFHVANFWWAILFAIVLSLVHMVLHRFRMRDE